jgi:DNA helicase-2/ATP-dependent DNA helicase PcrA
VSELVSFVIEKSGLKDALQNSKDPDDYERVENLKELVTYATRYDHSEDGVQEMLADIALASDQDSLDQKTDSKDNRVRLMTVHASKGLEFAYVFIVGLEQDLFPHSFDGSKKSDDEEERRLFYVALTRAKERVFLSHAMMRTIYGEQRLQEPSEFLSDLPDEILQHVQEEQPEQNQFSSWKNNNKNDGDTFEYLVID